MCGIWFSAGLAAGAEAIDLVAHRGPDGRGWRAFENGDGPVLMGHRRLAIIDLSEDGAQPMSFGDDRLWITYNGEIYNYLELRDELARLGCRFRTQSDTEVILAAYDRWGAACLERLVGMFAFVIYEPRSGRVFAARDRFGIKPLYWFATPRGFAFASEIKQFTSLAEFAARLNRRRAYDFLMGALTNHTGETLFDGVQQLRAGHSLAIDLAAWRRDRRIEPHRWYRLPQPDSLDISEAEAADRFRGLFEEAVRLHLRADVTVGSCLSGGLDSSSIVCVMADELRRRQAGNAIHTISSCFEERSVDERPFIEAVVRHARVESSYVFPQWQDLAADVQKIAWHQDEPFGSTSIFAQWCVFQRARQENIKVMLDGQGADEQLAGYHGVFGVYCASLLAEGRYLELMRTLVERRRYHGQSLRQQLFALFGARLPRPLALLLRGRRTAQIADKLLHVEEWREAELTKSPSVAALERDGFGPIDSVGRLCQALTQTVNLTTLLHFEDRNSMAHGVEARVPFLDHRLVDFTIALGSRHKVVGAETKRVLRRAMAATLPQQVLKRQDKLGFPTPEEIWFRGPLKSTVRGWVEDSLRVFPTLLDAAGVRRLADDMLEGRRPFDFMLWRIISFGLWGSVFKVAA